MIGILRPSWIPWNFPEAKRELTRMHRPWFFFLMIAILALHLIKPASQSKPPYTSSRRENSAANCRNVEASEGQTVSLTFDLDNEILGSKESIDVRKHGLHDRRGEEEGKPVAICDWFPDQSSVLKCYFKPDTNYILRVRERKVILTVRNVNLSQQGCYTLHIDQLHRRIQRRCCLTVHPLGYKLANEILRTTKRTQKPISAVSNTRGKERHEDGSEKEDTHLSASHIVGLVVAILVFILVLVAVVLFYLHKRRQPGYIAAEQHDMTRWESGLSVANRSELYAALNPLNQRRVATDASINESHSAESGTECKRT